MTSPNRPCALNVNNVSVTFGGLKAVNAVNFDVKKGEIVSVIGPNGAGKTTVFNAVTGVYQPTTGDVRLEGRLTEKRLSVRTLLGFVGIGVFTGFFVFGLVNIETLWRLSITDVYVYRQPFSWGQGLRNLIQGAREIPHPYSWLPIVLGFLVGVFGSYSVWSSGRRSPDVVSREGISRTFQNIRLFPDLGVLENVLVGMDATFTARILDCAFRSGLHCRENKVALARARELLEFVGLDGRERERAGCLPYGLQRRLEIARALARNPCVLLLDEPAAGMNPTESQELMHLIEKIRGRGASIVLIEHHMDVVMGISDRVIVLDYGNKIAEGTPDEIQANPKVIEAYLGKEVEA